MVDLSRCLDRRPLPNELSKEDDLHEDEGRHRQPSSTAHAAVEAQAGGGGRTVASGIAWTLTSQNFGSRMIGSVSADATMPAVSRGSTRTMVSTRAQRKGDCPRSGDEPGLTEDVDRKDEEGDDYHQAE